MATRKHEGSNDFVKYAYLYELTILELTLKRHITEKIGNVSFIFWDMVFFGRLALQYSR